MIHDEHTNNKLLVLFVLDKLEMPIAESVLLEICQQNDWINYIFCKEAIVELSEAGFVNRVLSQGKETMLSLSPDGALCIGHFFKDIAKSLRDEIVEVVKKNRLIYRRKQEYFSDYFRNPDNTFTVVLKILDVNNLIYETRLILSDRSTAQRMCELWPERGAEVYKSFYEILISDE